MICGGGALVGSAWLHFADAPNSTVAAGLKTCALGMAILGLGLFQFVLGGPEPEMLALCFAVLGTLVAIVLFAWGLGQMAETPLHAGWMGFVLVLTAISPWTLLGLGPLALGLLLAWGMATGSFLMLWCARRFIAHPSHLPARVIGICMVAFTAANLLRLLMTLRYEGAPMPHLIHMPMSWWTPYALLYGVLPILVSMLLMALVNAQLRDQLLQRASTDELTDALTRRAVREQATPHIAHTRRITQESAVMMFDLDHFKRINDTHGHHVGDEVLRQAAAALRRHLRPESLFARYGGEEFIAVVPVIDLPSARRVAERLREAVATTPMGADAALYVTVSVGITLVDPGEDLDAALQRADAALYRAKHEGRNQVQFSLKLA